MIREEWTMAKLPSEAHGVIDYLTASTLIALPRIFGLRGKLASMLTAVGLGTITYSLLTRYELGVLKVLPFKTHLKLDAMNGALMTTAPLLFRDEYPRISSLLVGIGVFEMAVTALSEPKAFQDDWANELVDQISENVQQQTEQIRETVRETAGHLTR
jgi:hypothetical protein